jgi:hypothetical protein
MMADVVKEKDTDIKRLQLVLIGKSDEVSKLKQDLF